MTARGHRQIDHTADIALEIWAPSLAELFVEGAVAMVDVLTDGRPVGGGTTRSVALSCVDPEDGLVAWLNEVLYWAVTEGFLFADGTAEVSTEEIVVEASGEAVDERALATELKSVTYHHLLLEERAGGWFGRVVVDV